MYLTRVGSGSEISLNTPYSRIIILTSAQYKSLCEEDKDNESLAIIHYAQIHSM
jgi:hypothetical protein